MTTAQRAGIGALALAVMTGAWLVWTAVASGAPATWHLLIAGVPAVVAGLAGWALTRHESSWRQPALAYVVVHAAVVSTGLPAALDGLWQPAPAGMAWTMLALTALGIWVLFVGVQALRSGSYTGPVPAALSRALAGVGGLCAVASFFVPRFTATDGSLLGTPPPLLDGALVRVSEALLLIVVIATTAFLVGARNRLLWTGAVGGLAASLALAVASLFDPTVAAEGAELAAGTFLAVGGAAVLLLALVTELIRGGPPVAPSRGEEARRGQPSVPPRAA